MTPVFTIVDYRRNIRFLQGLDVGDIWTNNWESPFLDAFKFDFHVIWQPIKGNRDGISQYRSNARYINENQVFQWNICSFQLNEKKSRFEAFAIVSLICSFHNRLFVSFTASNFTLFTTSKGCPFKTIGSKTGWSFEKEILSSLHFSLFNFTLFTVDQWITLSTIAWALLFSLFVMTSEVVVSSTYFHMSAFLISQRFKSLINTRYNHGLTLSPEGPRKERSPILKNIRRRVLFAVSDLIENRLSNWLLF